MTGALLPAGDHSFIAEGQITRADKKKPIVLLVEDSQDDAFIFNWTLEKSGVDASVHHAWHGGEAVEFLSQAWAAGPDALPTITFLDLKMPILNGFEVLDWLRAQPFAAQVPVAVLSGSEQHEDKVRALSLGASNYLVKPVTVAAIQKYLKGTLFKTSEALNHCDGNRI